MLRTLVIRDYALIDRLEVEFESGLNIITGETGAGKSIIVDSMALLLGERASPEVVRQGREKAVVEGTFLIGDNRRMRALLSANEIEGTDELIVRREVSAKGQSRAFLNDTPATLALLRSAGDFLVDLHGQHEHQSLLRPESHIVLLDEFGSLAALADEYRTAYHALEALVAERRSLHARREQLAAQRELHDFQLKEINAVAPRAGEEDELEARARRLEHAETLFAATARLVTMLYEDENSIHDQLVRARNELDDLRAIDASFGAHFDETNGALASVDELAKALQRYNAGVEFNPEELETIRERLVALRLLKKKYGGSLDAVIAHQERIAAELELADNFDDECARVDREIAAARETMSTLAARLSAKRSATALRVQRGVIAALAELGIERAAFSVHIDPLPATGDDQFAEIEGRRVGTRDDGIDAVEFYFSANVGEEPQPLSRVASGGEVSRTMLALKSVLAKSDRLPLLVFDEIDTGISGRIAQKVGAALRDLARFHQIIAITHLPQIASQASVHFAVEKSVRGGRTSSAMRKLSNEERVTEVAKLLAGEDVTAAASRSARELIASASKRE
jgi:DNA repair protein RecN (Recombination protein N)